MSPFRKRTDPKADAGEPVFIDLGLATVHDADDRTRVRIVRADEDKDLRHVRRWVSSGALVIVDLSSYSGDFQVAEAILREVEGSTQGVARKVGSDTWIVVPGNVIVEVPKR